MKTNTLCLATWVILALALLGCLNASAVNWPVGTFIIHGLAKSEKNRALGLATEDESLRMQAVAKDGTILAESSFFMPTAGDDPENFTLEVPMTLLTTDRSAAVGDKVRLCLAKNGVAKAVLSEEIVLFSEIGTTNLLMQLYETVSYTNKNGKILTVPADYVRSLGASFPGQDVLTAYDPFADYDGDGASNYLEYRAGTNPFDKSDRLKILAFAREISHDAITFEYVGGVVYGVSTSPSLEPAKMSWTEREITTQAIDGPGGAKRIMPKADVSEVGRETFYLLPTEKADSMFYKLEVK